MTEDNDLLKRMRECPYGSRKTTKLLVEAADRIEALEAKLAKAVEALRHAKLNMPHPDQMIDDTLAELEGDKP